MTHDDVQAIVLGLRAIQQELRALRELAEHQGGRPSMGSLKYNIDRHAINAAETAAAGALSALGIRS